MHMIAKIASFWIPKIKDAILSLTKQAIFVDERKQVVLQ